MAVLVISISSAVAIELPSMPKSLPIGSAQAIREWIVMNNIQGGSPLINFDYSVYYTDNLGRPGSRGQSVWTSFPSYPAYQRFIASNSFRIFNEVFPAMQVGTTVRFVSGAAYILPDLSEDFVEGMRISTNIGLASLVTSNSFIGRTPYDARMYIRMQGIQTFKVEVRGIYTNTWPADPNRPKQTPPPELGFAVFPSELTTNNWLVLNPWYCDGSKDTTFTLSTPGKTNHFGRYGERRFEVGVDNAPLMSSVQGKMAFSYAPGSVVTIQSLTNATSSWKSYTNFTDTGMIGYNYMPIDTRESFRVFRIYVTQ